MISKSWFPITAREDEFVVQKKEEWKTIICAVVDYDTLNMPQRFSGLDLKVLVEHINQPGHLVFSDSLCHFLLSPPNISTER